MEIFLITSITKLFVLSVAEREIPVQAELLCSQPWVSLQYSLSSQHCQEETQALLTSLPVAAVQNKLVFATPSTGRGHRMLWYPPRKKIQPTGHYVLVTSTACLWRSKKNYRIRSQRK